MNPVEIFAPHNMLTLVVAVGAFITITALFGPMLSGNRLEGRLKSLAVRRESCASARARPSPRRTPAGARCARATRASRARSSSASS
jgi:hypothetical protein